MRKQIFIWILLLLFSINFSFGQTKKVTGNVTDEKGKILSGATIEIKNTKLKKIKNIIRWIPVLWKDRDWDDWYIYKILQKKIEYQRKEIIYRIF